MREEWIHSPPDICGLCLGSATIRRTVVFFNDVYRLRVLLVKRSSSAGGITVGTAGACQPADQVCASSSRGGEVGGEQGKFRADIDIVPRELRPGVDLKKILCKIL